MAKFRALSFVIIFFFFHSFIFATATVYEGSRFFLQNSTDLSVPCQNETGSIDYKQYYTDPEISGEIIYVIFRAKMEKEGDDAWALALFHGFKYAYSASSKGEKLAVGILFTNETGKIYYIERKVYADFQNGKISNDEFVRRIQIEEVE